MLALYNGANEEDLQEALRNQKELFNEILKPKGNVLYYQQPNLSSSETSSERFYQLTLSNQLWLKNAQRYGKYCIGVDSKYDLNSDRAPVLAVVAENDAGFGTPLVFGLSNKENNWTTSIALKSLKNNILCNDSNCEHKWYYEDLPNEKGFQRITECAKNHNWILLTRYPIALAFKIVGRSRSIELAKELGPLYSEFINSLDITQELKN
ncbi:unnamed protein product [Rhizophagus irregularis]|nr:unnamed protein product [Rhizophagus irregularis]